MLSLPRNDLIIGRYKAGDSPVDIGREFNISARQVQRIVQLAGVSRTQSESYRLAIDRGRMRYYKKPEHLKVKRKSISEKQRFNILTRDNFTCQLCGATRKDGVRIEIDHKDNIPTNNTEENLWVLCQLCNRGKAMNQNTYWTPVKRKEVY